MKRVDGAASVSEEPICKGHFSRQREFHARGFIHVNYMCRGEGGRNWLMFGELRSSQGKDRGDQSLTTEYKGWSPSLQEIHHH